MRRRKARRELAALGYAPHYASDQLRHRVRVLVFNGEEHDRIAEILGIDIVVLRYHYSKELRLTDAEVLAQAASNVMKLASQERDLGVALRANELMLRTRSPKWREPKAADPPIEDVDVPIETMTLEQVERELARLGDRGHADPAPAADAGDTWKPRQS